MLATRLSVARTWLIAGLLPVNSSEIAESLAQLRVLAAQPLGLGRALDQQQQALGLERLFDEIHRPATDRRDGGVDVAVAREDDDRQFRFALP